jgi:hypothetical protein
MRQLPVACPRCGTTQLVGIRHLDKQLGCDTCGSLFYVDAGGACVRGRRPSDLGHAGRPDHLKPTRAAPQPLHVPRGAGIGLGVVVAIGAAWLLSRSLATTAGGPPESLGDRADYVAAAFARDDLDAILELAEPGTTVSLRRWYELKRNPNWPLWRSGPPGITTSTLYRKEAGRSAATVSTLEFPSADTTAPSPRLELVVFWSLGDDRLWRIDGGRMVREAANIR